MSNTGDGKKLATFNVEAETWEAFKAKARENGVNASVLLNQWVKAYLDESSTINIGKNLDSQTSHPQTINEESLIEKLAPTLVQQVRAEIESHLGDLVNNLIDANLPAAVEAHLGKE